MQGGWPWAPAPAASRAPSAAVPGFPDRSPEARTRRGRETGRDRRRGRERGAIRVACARARLRVSSQPRPGPVAATLGLLVGGAVRPPPVGDRSCSVGVQEPRPRYDPRGTGESPAAPRLAFWDQPPQLQLFRPRPSPGGRRTEVRGGAARVSAWPCKGPSHLICRCLATEPWGPRSSGASRVPCARLTGWTPGLRVGHPASPSRAQEGRRTPEVIGQSCRGKRTRRTGEEARQEPPPRAARLGCSSHRESPARLGTPAPATRLQAHDLDSNIVKRSRALAPEINI